MYILTYQPTNTQPYITVIYNVYINIYIISIIGLRNGCVPLTDYGTSNNSPPVQRLPFMISYDFL